MVRNVVRIQNQQQPKSAWELVENVRSNFVQHAGWAGDIKLMPVLFDRKYLNNPASYMAATANVVNCLPLHPHVYMQHPYNNHWTHYISEQMPDDVTLHFLDQPEIWDNYHRHQGSIHCGSAVRRTIDFSEPWWEKENLQRTKGDIQFAKVFWEIPVAHSFLFIEGAIGAAEKTEEWIGVLPVF